jgi:DNA-binding transcriptional LysR family regulator
VSRQVAQLEANLGAPLIHRITRKLEGHQLEASAFNALLMEKAAPLQWRRGFTLSSTHCL